jgi:hypothetical protein
MLDQAARLLGSLARSRPRRALLGSLVTWANVRERKVLGREWGAESASAFRPGLATSSSVN